MLVVIGIIGVLAAVAYPSYIDHVRKARMNDAQLVLLEAAQWMEKVYNVGLVQGGVTLSLNQYPSAAQFTQLSGLTQSPKGDGTAYYLIGKSSPSGASQDYTLTATPQGNQDWRGCGALTIDNLGIKGAGGALTTCWP